MLQKSVWFLCRCGFNFLTETGWKIDGRLYCGKCASKVRTAQDIIARVIETVDADYEDYDDEGRQGRRSWLMIGGPTQDLRERFPQLTDDQVDGIISVFETEVSITWERWNEVDGPRVEPELDFPEDRVKDRILALL